MRHRHKRRLPIEGFSDTEEALFQMVVALTSQVSVMRERLDTIETLLASNGTLDRGAIEDIVLGPEDIKRRDALREALVAKVMRPIAAGLENDIAELEEGQ